METSQLVTRLEKIEKNLYELKMEYKDILSLDEACSYLSIKKSYIYKLTSSNRLLGYKPEGKLLYFKKEDLKNFLLRNPVLTSDEIEKNMIENIGKNKRA